MAPVVAITSGGAGGRPVNAAPNVPADRAHTQAVTQAVNNLNAIGFAGEGREVTIALDPVTHQPVVRVIDKNTSEVLHQWPSKYVLQLAEEYKSRGSR